jgi:hypothetical protein
MLRTSLYVVVLGTCAALGLVWHVPIATNAADTQPAKPDAQAADKVVAELKLIGELIKQLDDDKFEKRQQATEQLIKIGRPAVEPLRRLLASNPNLELAKRATGILEAMPKEKSKGRKTRELIAALNKTVDLDKGIDANTPLKDALEFIGEQSNVPFIVDSKAFEAIGVQKVEEQPVQLAKMTGVRLANVLRLLLGQVKGDVYTGTFLVRSDSLEITTTYHSLVEAFGGNLPAFAAGEDPKIANDDLVQILQGKARVLYQVYADFEKRPLKEALDELAEFAAINVMVDPRVGDKAKTPVTATINNMFVDTAVELLADMADLQVVQKDAVFYLTTKENAARLEAQRKPRPIVPPAGIMPKGPPPAQ